MCKILFRVSLTQYFAKSSLKHNAVLSCLHNNYPTKQRVNTLLFEKITPD